MSSKATTTAASAALAILLTIGVPAMSAASTFVYVSDVTRRRGDRI